MFWFFFCGSCECWGLRRLTYFKILSLMGLGAPTMISHHNAAATIAKLALIARERERERERVPPKPMVRSVARLAITRCRVAEAFVSRE